MISRLLYFRKDLAKQLLAIKPSPARTLVISLLKLSRSELILTVADNWFRQNYGVKPFQTTIDLPAKLVPILDQEQAFQLLTDHLKKCI